MTTAFQFIGSNEDAETNIAGLHTAGDEVGNQEKIMPPIIDKDKYNACGVCAEICTTDVFSVPGKNETKI